MNLRIGVVGLGAIGPSHIRAIRQVSGCELAAVCDVREEAAARAGREHGVPHFTRADEMARAAAIDAATVCTPSGYHLDAALALIQAGKHVLVEKPIEITPERIDRLIRAAEERGVMLAGVFQSRFKPVVQSLKQMVDGGILGDLYAAGCYVNRYRTQQYYDSGAWRGTWAVDGGGCLMNQGIHFADLFVWFAGEVEEVIGITETKGRRVEIETLATALVKFHGGARGILSASTLAYPEFPDRIELIGSRGTLTFTDERVLHLELMDPTPAEAAAREALLEECRRRASAETGLTKPAVAPGTAVPAVDMGHTPVVRDFVDAARTGRRPAVDGREARRSVEFITAIYESSRGGGRPVRFSHAP